MTSRASSRRGTRSPRPLASAPRPPGSASPRPPAPAPRRERAPPADRVDRRQLLREQDRIARRQDEHIRAELQPPRPRCDGRERRDARQAGAGGAVAQPDRVVAELLERIDEPPQLVDRPELGRQRDAVTNRQPARPRIALHVRTVRPPSGHRPAAASSRAASPASSTSTHYGRRPPEDDEGALCRARTGDPSTL